MTRILLLTIALALTAPAAQALTQLELSVRQDLREYGFRDVDVEKLTTAQLVAISHIAHAKNDNKGGKRAQIRSVLGKSYSLRGILFPN
ncbi:hypothetical protein [Ovoidimarina sediminis]|uniref:hypothetical protein n=1 Tax=Ovoidimarina sediminis TaxID=3079856 RepID=UPI00290C3010|nr:hypothetical protein [Rhodophyticola sp. MJ-SS7]MDU8943968.1 hypothetical protein [Rhodophyticola sp. MJ-SS7]